MCFRERLLKRAVTLSILSLGFFGCGGGSNEPAGAGTGAQQLSGQWQLVLTPSNPAGPGAETIIEATFPSGDGFTLSNAANSLNLFVNTFDGLNWWVGGTCAPWGSDAMQFTISANNVTFTLNEGNYDFTGTGAISGSTQISGTYSSAMGSSCHDSGTFLATKVNPLSNCSAGSLAFSELASSKYYVSMCFIPQSGSALTLSGTYGTPQAVQGNWNLSGNAVGNGLYASGTNPISNAPMNIAGFEITEPNANPVIAVYDLDYQYEMGVLQY